MWLFGLEFFRRIEELLWKGRRKIEDEKKQERNFSFTQILNVSTFVRE